MSLSAAQITQVFEVLGVPQNGSGDVIGSVATLFGPAWETYDVSSIVTRVNARIAALTSAQETRVAGLLERWDAIGATSPLHVVEAADARGTLANHPAERAAIRYALANIIGVAAPSGGFAEEAQRLAGGAEVSR
jgi:hypothetical protein